MNADDTAPRPARSDAVPGLSVASFNARYGTDRDERPFDVAAAVGSFDSDVIALQEVFWPDDGAGFTEDLKDLGYEVIGLPLMRAGIVPKLRAHAEPSDNTGWWGIAVATRLPVAGSDAIWIGNLPIDPAGERHALRVELELPDRQRISVTTLHATHYVPLAPIHHLRLARGLGRPRRSVVVGDFNMWGPPTSLFFRGWQRPVRGRSFPAHRPHSQIDHLFASADLEVADAEVLDHVGSDHRPIRARVLLGAEGFGPAATRRTLSTS